MSKNGYLYARTCEQKGQEKPPERKKYPCCLDEGFYVTSVVGSPEEIRAIGEKVREYHQWARDPRRRDGPEML